MEVVLTYDTAIAYKPHNGYIEPPPEPPKPKPVIAYACNCTMYLWNKYKDPRIKGWQTAKNIPVWSEIPYSTGYAVTYESGAGHLLMYQLLPDGRIQVTEEANYVNCQVTSGRIVNPNVIKGFIP